MRMLGAAFLHMGFALPGLCITGLIQAGFITALLAMPAGLASANEPATGLQRMTGCAYETDSGELVYREEHYQNFDNGELTTHQVEYTDPRGKPLAIKTIDYRGNPFAPDLILQDWRDGYMEGAKNTEQGYELERRLNKNAELRQKLIKPGGDLVSDAGFDRYVRAHLAELLKTGSRRFEMAVPGRLDSFRFEARLDEKGELFGRPAVKFKMQPATLLRLLTGSIDITYDLDTGNLLRYEGISNIRKPDGKRYDARIDFPPDERTFSPIGHETGRHRSRKPADPCLRE